ncbi:multivesicular body subunit 12B-like [Pomacea canaliculata]|uniref:multivesicular body subunit 12B-like n=1 Tax=Pomacea canaliculata TaxID=400727 RepID=UPI000D729C21|nr:multivesicular body subunit 12B-like [Pomacea canaliculata]XP_025112961.1 multivesicular body subunit 12B-like [Pomacea canaliculata]XP_025112962.1 multivesicular body subunit 12B-like [Pomacea canaliculata]
MDPPADWPITGVCIVSDPNRAPPNYTVIDKTYDKSEDADLWKDGPLRRRTMRYLCVKRSVPDQTDDVLVDVTFINEKDPVPAGFAVVDTTHDTREKALQKKQLCLRWMVSTMTNDAITELIFLSSKASRRPPGGYTLIGETNSMSLCFKMGKLPKPPVLQPPAETSQSYPLKAFHMAPVASSLPYSLPPNKPSGSTVLRPENIASHTSTISPISGIPWQLNPKLKNLTAFLNMTIPEVRYKSILDIEKQYDYDFRVENSASRVQPERS